MGVLGQDVDMYLFNTGIDHCSAIKYYFNLDDCSQSMINHSTQLSDLSSNRPIQSSD
jgi:hypothetical protein